MTSLKGETLAVEGDVELAPPCTIPGLHDEGEVPPAVVWFESTIPMACGCTPDAPEMYACRVCWDTLTAPNCLCVCPWCGGISPLMDSVKQWRWVK